MRLFHKLRAYFALGSYLLGVVLLGAPHLYGLILWHRVRRSDGTARRRAVARWQMTWGNALGGLTFRLMGIDATYALPPVREHLGRPLIVVSNHPSGPLDGFILMAMFGRMGRKDFRSIMKREVMKVPVIGRSCIETECAFLARGGSRDADLAEIARCGATAFVDRACVIIFPEGTRFRGPKEGSGLSRVLPPKSAGLRALIDAMPGAPVLSVTIAWDRDIRNGKDTASSIGAYVGAKVVVEASIIEDIDPAFIEAWLRDEWRRKDARLASTGA
jgi:1-acyl-sn-glycerol-3-phosphate acyltransferase